MIECLNCDSSRRGICEKLFSDRATIQLEAVKLFEANGFIDRNPGHALDMMKSENDKTAHYVLGLITNWNCQLTLQQVYQKLIESGENLS